MSKAGKSPLRPLRIRHCVIVEAETLVAYLRTNGESTVMKSYATRTSLRLCKRNCGLLGEQYYGNPCSHGEVSTQQETRNSIQRRNRTNEISITIL